MKIIKILFTIVLLNFQSSQCKFYILITGEGAQEQLDKSKKKNEVNLTYSTGQYSAPFFFLIDKNTLKSFETYNNILKIDTILAFSCYDSLGSEVTSIKIFNSDNISVTDNFLYILKFDKKFKGWYCALKREFYPKSKNKNGR